MILFCSIALSAHSTPEVPLPMPLSLIPICQLFPSPTPPHPQPLVTTAILTVGSMVSDSTHGIMKCLAYFTDRNDV